MNVKRRKFGIFLFSAIFIAAILLITPKVGSDGDEVAFSDDVRMAAAELTDSTTVSLSLTEDDKSLIAWLVACEADGYPYMTKVCVAATILNRLENDSFADTARGLIFESEDFESVYRGLVTGSPTVAQCSTKKYRLGMKALEEALAGKDPTGGALYYADAKDVDSGVLNGYECGGMIFGT